MKALYLILGGLALALGVLGAVVPLLPAFPFFMLSTFCFARSSRRLNNWFLGSGLYKNNLESFVRGKGMTAKTKGRIIALVTVTIAVGFLMMSRVPVARVILTVVWLCHLLYFLLGIKTLPAGQTKVGFSDRDAAADEAA